MGGSGFVQCDLSNDEIGRYGRQMIMKEWGADAQQRLCQGRVLIIGAGGLGSPVALYLAGAGVGHLTIIDHDRVERSNLHRQIIHRDSSVGEYKAISAQRACLDLNPLIDVVAITERFDEGNAIDLVRQFDVIVDATDNVSSRYMINDAALLAGKPIVCGSALGMEGQLTVYGYHDGPCYRCVFPSPPPRAAVADCNNSGVLGPVPGIIGTLQALEVVKLLGQVGEILKGRFLIFDALNFTSRIVRLRPKSSTCPSCGTSPGKLSVSHASGCGTAPVCNEVSVEELEMMCRNEIQLIDVRERVQFDICHLIGARNVPIGLLKETARQLVDDGRPIYCICRRGVMSKHAAAMLAQLGVPAVFSVQGGMTSWSLLIDTNCPIY